MLEGMQMQEKELNLVTANEAAKALYVTRGMVHYWIRKGRVKKHKGSNNWNFLVDMEEARFASRWQENIMEQHPDLITKEEAADLLLLSKRSVSYYVDTGRLNKYYVLGSDKYYLLSRDEVIELSYREPFYLNEVRNEKLRKKALLQKKDKNGKFCR
jgi:hypothetical protein